MDALDIVYIVFTAIIGLLRGTYQIRHGRLKAIRRDESMADRLLLAFAVLAMIPIPLCAVLTPWFDFADIALPATVAWFGVPFLAAGAWLFWRSHADLGANWSARIAIQASHALVETGVYSRIRHPMYAALLISGIGQALVLRNWLAGSSLLAAAVLFYLFRIPREERMLESAFGDAYRAYAARTGRVVPKRR
jgi:protein-S-isoprenylcysteine O-methyltransferase Ste14